MGYTFNLQTSGGVAESEEEATALDSFAENAQEKAKEKFQQSSQFQQLQASVMQGTSVLAQTAVSIVGAGTTLGMTIMAVSVVTIGITASFSPAPAISTITDAVQAVVAVVTPTVIDPPSPVESPIDNPIESPVDTPFFVLPPNFVYNPPAPTPIQPPDPRVVVTGTPLTGNTSVALLDQFIRANVCQ